VLIDGNAVRSCQTQASAAAGRSVTTLEGLMDGGKPGKLQQAFIDEQAAQCGYCLNGWLMTAAALLEGKPNATDEDIRRGLSGLKCRCGTHMSILRAVKLAATRMSASRKA
ncbi:MAG: 2Fe-2S iron-sulfur cluster-binding protein, partial [Candidatus Eisenbacteria bacterium]